MVLGIKYQNAQDPYGQFPKAGKNPTLIIPGTILTLSSWVSRTTSGDTSWKIPLAGNSWDAFSITIFFTGSNWPHLRI